MYSRFPFRGKPRFGKGGFSIPQNGFLRVFTSNTGTSPAEINNTKITIVTGQLVEEYNYYPYGLVFDHTSSIGINQTNFLFNGKELQRNEFGINNGIELIDFINRPYDQQTGRFIQTDKLAIQFSNYSSYNYCFGNPVLFIDPDGNAPTEYIDENGKTLANTNDGNKSKVVVKDDKRKEFDKTMSQMNKDGTTNDATANQSLINKITPADQPLYFTNQSYGLQYLDLAQQQNKVEMAGFLESKGGLVVAPREGFLNGKLTKNDIGNSYPGLLKMNHGKTTVNEATYKLTAHVHTHPNSGDYPNDFSGQLGMARTGDIQDFQTSFYKSNNISTFYLIGPNRIQGAYIGKSGRVENI